MKKFILSLFAKPRTETLIQGGKMYHVTYKGHREIKRKEIPHEYAHGGHSFTENISQSACTDRKRTNIGDRVDTGIWIDSTDKDKNYFNTL